MASDWRQRVGPASFRGVSFFAEVIEGQAGRRNAVHEYPFSEDPPYVEDMGKRSVSFRVEGYVIGDDYLDKRDELSRALQQGGPGEFVHPRFGSRTVAVGAVQIRDVDSEGGLARFSIEFLRTRERPANPTTAPSSTAAVTASAASAQTAVIGAFSGAWNTASRITTGVSAALRGATRAIDNVTAKVAFVTQTASRLRAQTAGLANSAVALASAPGDIVSSTVSVFDALRDAVLNAENVTDPIGVFLGVYGFNPGDPIPQTTPTRLAEFTNTSATQRLFQRLAIVNAARVAIDTAFASYDEAVFARARITELIDEQAEIAADDTYAALTQLRADLVKAVPGDTSDLPRLITVTPPVTVPSLVLAHKLYGADGGRFGSLEAAAEDVVKRNRVRHPGFLIGGVPLQVLSDE